MAEIVINETLIELGVDVPSKEQVIRILADKLYFFNYVKDGYYENVIRREKDFPTGLPTVIPISVCHTEAQYVNQSALALGTLAHPIEFQEMGTPERTVQAEIVFLLALNDPKEQVPWLKKMASVFKNREALETIRDASSKVDLAGYLRKLFLS